MTEGPFAAGMVMTLHRIVQIALAARVLLRPHREPAARIAWTVVILVFPVLGILDYILLGGTNLGCRRVACWDWRRRIGNNAIAMLGPVL